MTMLKRVNAPQAATNGRIELIMGPMFSGKTTELLRRCRRHRIATRKCLLVKYAKDTRYSDTGVATHDKVVDSAIACFRLSSIREKCADYDVIGVDEGQFYDDVVEFADDMAMAGKIVIIAALDGTFERKPFGRMCELIPKAEGFTKLTAICSTCGEDAPFTRRLGSETDVEIIGGTEMYMASCRSCFTKDGKELHVASKKQKLCVEVEKARQNVVNDTPVKTANVSVDKRLSV